MPRRSKGSPGRPKPPTSKAGFEGPFEDLPAVSAALLEMARSFATAEEWLGQVAERVARMEAVLFRTPVSNFLQMDKVIEGIVQGCALQPLVPDLGDDLFCTARDISDILGQTGCKGDPLEVEAQKPKGPSCLVSIGCISTDIGESGTVTDLSTTVNQSSKVEQLRPPVSDESTTDISLGRSSTVEGLRQPEAPSRRTLLCPKKLELKPRDWLEASGGARSCDELEGSHTHVAVEADDIFQDIDKWSTLSSVLDPTWTEPVPRGLEVVVEVPSQGASSPDSGALPERGAEGALPREDGCPPDAAGPDWCSNRTPSPEREHGAIDGQGDDRGRMIAHLIAENARLQALVQAQGADLGRPPRPRKLSKKERERRQRRASVEAPDNNLDIGGSA